MLFIRGILENPQRFRPLILLVAAALLLAAGPARAISTDIETFTSSGTAPNILLLLDTSGTMGNCPASGCEDGMQKWEIAKTKLIELVEATNPSDGGGGYVENARFGLMVYDDENHGALLKQAISDGNTGSMLATLNALTSADFFTWTPNAASHIDAVRYFAGAAGWGPLPVHGTLVTFTGGGLEPTAPSPIDSTCRANVIVQITDGISSRENPPGRNGGMPTGTTKYGNDPNGMDLFCSFIGNADGDAEEPLCPLPVAPDNNTWLDDVTYKAYREDFSPLTGTQNIVSHTISYDIDSPNLLDAATNGGGQFFNASTGDELLDALAKATQGAIDGSFGFSAPSVSTFRTALSDGFFLASFEASSDEAFWPGHLQAFRLAPDLTILDKNGNPAVDPNTGVFNDPPNHFWDAGEELAKASHPPRNLYITKMVPTALREAFAYAKVSATDLGLTSADLTLYPNYPSISFASTNALRDGLVDYIWGQDTFDQDGDGITAELREGVLGDIFHSSAIQIGPPPAYNLREDGFGPASDPLSFWATHQHRDRKLMVGANDGMLHAFDSGAYNAGDNPATPETENGYYDLGTGQEDFGYIPGFLQDTLKYIPINKPRQHYYVDGTPSAADIWIPKNASDTSKEPTEWATALVMGMKDGASGYLALDVTDPTDSKYPEPLWELDETVLPIGNTWSEAVITRVKLEHGSNDFCGHITTDDGPCREQWVAIFGGGYRQDGDPGMAAYVSDPASAAWSDASKGIFMVTMDTGELIGQIVYDADPTATLNQMRFSIPSTPAVLDLDFDGFADVVYVGDLGGQMWRWDLSAVGEDTALSDGIMDNWPVGLLFKSDPATLGGGGTHHHPIFFPPVATYLNGELVLAFASGERTDLAYVGDAADDDNNRFWVLWDRTSLGLDPEDPNTNWVTIAEDHFTVNGVTRGLNDVTSLATDPDPFDDGYYIKAPDGEKFITNHVLFAGILITLSYDPTGTAPGGGGGGDPCVSSGGGISNIWVFNLFNAGGLLDETAAAGNDQRNLYVGPGVPGDPRITISKEKVQVVGRTSTGSVFEFDVPAAPPPPVELVFWRQLY